MRHFQYIKPQPGSYIHPENCFLLSKVHTSSPCPPWLKCTGSFTECRLKELQQYNSWRRPSPDPPYSPLDWDPVDPTHSRPGCSGAWIPWGREQNSEPHPSAAFPSSSDSDSGLSTQTSLSSGSTSSWLDLCFWLILCLSVLSFQMQGWFWKKLLQSPLSSLLTQKRDQGNSSRKTRYCAVIISCPGALELMVPLLLPFLSSPFFSKLLRRDEMIKSKWCWCPKYHTWPHRWTWEMLRWVKIWKNKQNPSLQRFL